MSHIVIAGGTGVLGQALAEYFSAKNRDVIVLSRRGGAAPGKVRHVQWNGLPAEQAEEWEQWLHGAAAVINMAGRSVNCRYTARNRRAMMDSRILSTRALAAALTRCKTMPAVWLNSSTATIYKHTFGPAHDERGEIGATDAARDAFSIEIATRWERELFASSTPIRKVALRTAVVLSHRPGNMVGILRRLARFGLGGRMGDGKQWVSWVHERDFCRAVEFLIEHPELEGPVNVAAPNPVTNAEMMQAFRQLERRRIGLPAARWMLEVGAFVLRTETELLLKSRRVVPGRLVEAGFKFEFVQFEESLRNLASR